MKSLKSLNVPTAPSTGRHCLLGYGATETKAGEEMAVEFQICGCCSGGDNLRGSRPETGLNFHRLLFFFLRCLLVNMLMHKSILLVHLHISTHLSLSFFCSTKVSVPSRGL